MTEWLARMRGNRFLRFCVVGGVGFVVDAGILATLIGTTGNPYFARVLSILCAMTVTWWLNRRFTFGKSPRAGHHEWGIYVLFMGFGACVNYAVYSAGLWYLPLASLTLRALVALVIATAVAMLVNYNTMRLFVFGKPE